MAKAKAEFENSDEIESMFDVGVDDTGWLDEILKRSKSGQIDVLSNMLAEAAKVLDPDYEENASWIPQKGPQTEAFHSLADELFFGGSAGGGKLAVTGTLIATPFGWKKCEDVKVEDTLIAADGTATKVLAVYPKKDFEAYRVTFTDGATVDVGDDHLWFYWYAGKKIKAERKYLMYTPTKGVRWVPVRGRLGTTKELYEYHKKQEAIFRAGGRPYWIIIPLCKPIRYTRPSKTKHGDVIRIDPYLLGLLIGDGYIPKNGSICITTKDEEIKDWVIKYWGEDKTRWGEEKHLYLNDSKNLKDNLESYGLLDKKAFDKFIPEAYLFADVDTRFKLIDGLISTDGYIDSRGHISYTTVSPQLAKDFQHLARSLGAKATITSDVGSYKDENGDKVECREAYTVYIQADDTSRFCSLPRKAERIKSFNGGVSEAGRRIVSIEKIGKRDGACFAIDHPSGLHVVQDFIVTHNTDLLIGLAISEKSPHQRSIIFRETYGDLKDIAGRVLDIYPTAKFVAGQAMSFRNLPNNKVLELGNIPDFARAKRKYQGRPHDLKLFDELTNIDFASYVFLNGWNRTTVPGLRTRIVSAGNPPTNERGLWVVRRFAPWLDPDHSNPAGPGELRWFSTINGEDTELTGRDGGDGRPFEYVTNRGEREMVYPKSRTFIPSRLDDNEYYNRDPQYRATLQALPEPYRSMMLYGDFTMAVKPDQWQVVQRAWANASIDAWKKLREEGDLQSLTLADKDVAYGLDVASSGDDSSALTRMVGNVIEYIDLFKEPDLMKQADYVASKIYPKTAPIGVDENGIGLGLGQRLKQMGFRVLGFKGSTKSKSRTEDGQLGFENVRCEMWWRIREALNPNSRSLSVLKSGIVIPDNSILVGDLTAPRYEVRGAGMDAKIWVDPTDEIKRKTGRSPDAAMALALALMTKKFGHTKFRMV